MLIAILAVLGAVLTLSLHELSHVLAVKLTGGRITSYTPWPHVHEGKFYFGRVGVAYLDAVPLSHRWSHLAPLLKSGALGASWAFLAQYHYAPLWVLAGWEFVDTLWWQVGYYFRPSSDGGRWRRAKYGTTSGG